MNSKLNTFIVFFRLDIGAINAVIDFNVDPYYDDFEGTTGAKSKNFHRVLFRPGFPVQARELTQLQSILQKQLRDMADTSLKKAQWLYQ